MNDKEESHAWGRHEGLVVLSGCARENIRVQQQGSLAWPQVRALLWTRVALGR